MRPPTEGIDYSGDKPTTTEPVLERVERRLTVAFCGLLHAQRNLDADPPTESDTARAILREVADAVEEESRRGVTEYGGQKRICFTSVGRWIREQAAEEGAENG